RLSQLCPPYATPSSNSSLDYPRSDARIVEDGFATSGGLNRSAKVVLISRIACYMLALPATESTAQACSISSSGDENWPLVTTSLQRARRRSAFSAPSAARAKRRNF